jgi:hypothetical protein
MSTALRIAHGASGRVALLDMDRPLVRHAHPHCHVLLKVEGADTGFAVGDGIAPLTDRTGRPGKRLGAACLRPRRRPAQDPCALHRARMAEQVPTWLGGVRGAGLLRAAMWRDFTAHPPPHARPCRGDDDPS